MTNHWVDLKNADVILICGSNAAENHPASMAWVNKARDERKAKHGTPQSAACHRPLPCNEI